MTRINLSPSCATQGRGAGRFQVCICNASAQLRRDYVRLRRDYVRKNQAEHVSERIDADTLRRRKLVRRSHFLTIIAAWVITVPVTAALAAGLYGLSLIMR